MSSSETATETTAKLTETEIKLVLQLSALKAHAMVCKHCTGPVIPYDFKVKDDGVLIAFYTTCLICAKQRGWSVVPQMIDFLSETIDKIFERGYIQFNDHEIPRLDDGSCAGFCYGLCSEHKFFEHPLVETILKERTARGQ